jgi:hypothetical protein
MLNPIRTAAFLTEFFDIAPSTVRGPKKSGRPPPLGFEGQHWGDITDPTKKVRRKTGFKMELTRANGGISIYILGCMFP